MIGYEYIFGGGRQLTGKSIDQSTIRAGVDLPAGSINWGWTVEVTQSGRAGPTFDAIVSHADYPIHLGRLTLRPGTELGYARALDYDYGLYGARLRVSYDITDRLTTAVEIRERRSIPGTVNTAPLNASELPHTPYHELRVEADPLTVQISPTVSLTGYVARSWGPTRSTVFGLVNRLKF
jgi:hypothetical protein